MNKIIELRMKDYYVFKPKLLNEKVMMNSQQTCFVLFQNDSQMSGCSSCLMD